MPKTNRKTRIFCYIMIVLNCWMLFYLTGVPKSMESSFHFIDQRIIPHGEGPYYELTCDVSLMTDTGEVILRKGTVFEYNSGQMTDDGSIKLYFRRGDYVKPFYVSADHYIDCETANEIRRIEGEARYDRYIHNSDWFFLHPVQCSSAVSFGFIYGGLLSVYNIYIYTKRRSDILYIILQFLLLAALIYLTHWALNNRVFCR